MARSDAGLLGRMVRNLMENAVRYTERGGVHVRCRVEEGRAVISVRDLIVADYRLRAGHVGTEAILAIRDMVGEEVPAVLLTGETGPECQRDAAAHGFGLAHNPVTPRQLRGTLQRQLSDAA